MQNFIWQLIYINFLNFLKCTFVKITSILTSLEILNAWISYQERFELYPEFGISCIHANLGIFNHVI